MASGYVFISYSRQDVEFVRQLSAGMGDAGIRTWIDFENILPGEEWAQEIEKGLFQASAIIYVASKNSIHSKWMNTGLAAFIREDGHVIPIIIDDKGTANLPLPLREIQLVDFRGPFEPALHSLLNGIRSLQGPSPVETPKAKSKGYVFISYADEDSGFVTELEGFMKKQGYGYWDFRESKRDYQTDYSLELEAVIKDAAGTLSVVSPEWKHSPTTLEELHFSREVGTPVFVLKVKDPGPTLAIAGLTYIDFMKNHSEGFVKLDDEMKLKGL